MNHTHPHRPPVDLSALRSLRRAPRPYFLLAVLLLVLSCASQNRGNAVNSDSGLSLQDPQAQASGDEAKLRRVAGQYFQSIQRSQAEARNKVVGLKPHFYKEYSEYPEGPGSFRVDLHEKDSRTTPLFAELSLSKVRFATKFHQKKDRAEADETFVRETGTEIVSYELRSGKWRRVGSMFVATTIEELVDGQWRVVGDRPSSD